MTKANQEEVICALWVIVGTLLILAGAPIWLIIAIYGKAAMDCLCVLLEVAKQIKKMEDKNKKS